MGSYKGVRSPLIWVISIVTLLITLLITTHEPPSKPVGRIPQSLRFTACFRASTNSSYVRTCCLRATSTTV